MVVRRVLTSSWPAIAVTAVGVLTVLHKFGVSSETLGIYLVYLLVGIAVPGVFTWRLLLRSLHRDDEAPTWFEDLSLGTIFGFGLQLPFYLVGLMLGVTELAFLPVVLVVVLSLTPFGRSVWRLPTRSLDARASWAIGGVILYGMAWLSWNALFRRPLGLPPHRTTNLDETFHHALVSELSNRFPAEIPYLLGTRLDYHWFVHAQIATARVTTGIDTVVFLRFLIPALGLVLAVVGLGAVAHRLTGRPLAAVVAPGLLVAGAFHMMGADYPADLFTEPFLSSRFTWSPSQVYGVFMSMPVLMLLLEVLRPDRRPGRLHWVTLGLSLLALAGAKATFLPVFLCGALGAWGIHLLARRRVSVDLTILTGLLLAATLFAQFVLFGGQGGGLAFRPFQSTRYALASQGIEVTDGSVAAMSAAMLVGWLLYGSGAVGLVRHRPRLDPRVTWALTAIPAGIVVPFLLYRSGLSQFWFERATAELVVLLSAWGLTYLLPKPLTVSRAALLAVAGTALGTGAYLVAEEMAAREDNGRFATLGSVLLTVAVPVAVVLAFFLARGALAPTRWRGRPPVLLAVVALLGLCLQNPIATGHLALTEPFPDKVAKVELFAKGGAEAARYVESRSDADDVLATNIHCRQPDETRCDNRNFWLAAHSERRIVVEGWGYNAVTNAQHKPDTGNPFLPMPYPERLRINDAVFTEPSEENLRRLVESYGVSWLVVGKDYPVDLATLNRQDDLLSKEFANKNYVVYEVLISG